MSRRSTLSRAARWFALAVGLGGCGSGSGSGASTTTVSWPSTQAAYWIGKPSAGSSPVIVFLFDAPKTCASLANFNWDKIIGNMRVLEIGLDAAAMKAYPIRKEASVAYLQGAYNPDADTGTVTVASVTPGKSMAGSFDATFGGQTIKGSFDAAFCPEGVEP